MHIPLSPIGKTFCIRLVLTVPPSSYYRSHTTQQTTDFPFVSNCHTQLPDPTQDDLGYHPLPAHGCFQFLADDTHVGPSTLTSFPPSLSIDAPMPRSNDQQFSQDTVDNFNYRIETKQVFVCAYGTCNNRYARLADLRRHHRGAHQNNDQFKCRASHCPRAIRGFSRRDKRDSHEKSMHRRHR